MDTFIFDGGLIRKTGTPKGLYTFDLETGIWTGDERCLRKHIVRLKRELTFVQISEDDDKEKTFNYGGMDANIRRMIPFIHSYCETDDKFFTTRAETG